MVEDRQNYQISMKYLCDRLRHRALRGRAQIAIRQRERRRIRVRIHVLAAVGVLR